MKTDKNRPVSSIKHNDKRAAIPDSAHQGEEQMALIRFRYNPSSSFRLSSLLPYTSPVPVASLLITSTSLHLFY